MNSVFPDVQRWFDVLTMREQGLALIVLVTISTLGVLVNARFLYPRFLPLARNAAILAFWASFAVVVVRSL